MKKDPKIFVEHIRTPFEPIIKVSLFKERRLQVLKKILSIVFLVTVYCLLVTFVYAEEQITITTYYPSPYGSYNELTSNRMKIGRTYSGSGTTVADDNLIVEGRLGVGTTTFRSGGGIIARLDVNGAIVADDVYLANPVNGSPRWASTGYDPIIYKRIVSGPGTRLETSAICGSGGKILGGGCDLLQATLGGSLRSSYPNSDSSWYCLSVSDLESQATLTAYAICTK